MQSILTERQRHTQSLSAVERARASTTVPARVVIENVAPEIDCGRFPIKRSEGEEVVVSADIHADGHEVLAAELRWRFVGPPPSSTPSRAPSAGAWHEEPMREQNNDRWSGRFVVSELGHYEYTIVARIDRFASWQRELARKVAAGQEVTSELLEGAALVAAAARLARETNSDARGARTGREAAGHDSKDDATWLLELAEHIGDGTARGDTARDARSDEPDRGAGDDPGTHGAAAGRDIDARVRAALSEELAATMRRYSDRSHDAEYEQALRVVVEPVRATYGAWYELFPRSAGDDATRHGTFRDVERRLPEIAAMGFDVLYLPPIHPIGRSFRKGPNNTLHAGRTDPGSPWAIGGEEGGHKAVHPELGTLADFDRLVAAARRHHIEIALDIAFQCSPDHPYVRRHPEWFRHRPDGTIKYAENPPKKYQDIYPLDFECDDWRALWQELKSVVVHWIDHGVTIFRVDNPHTKPFRFWEWLIAEVKAEHPETIFLSEAFTRPKVMRHLAKAGFSQSYTYFTWRNTKQELTEYFTELTRDEVWEYMRPNLFANTPDILPEYLQYGGRAGFQVRLVLAATLGATYGIYGPAFELCEGRPLNPGREEYLDSEKYQICGWDRERSGNIRELIARINAVRRANPALHQNHRLRFYPVDNDQLIFYGKTTPDLENIVLVVVNLDPHHTHSGWVQVPLAELGIAATDTYQVHDLISDSRFLWHGARNFVRLDPAVCPAHVLRLRRRVKTERDFDYFM